MNTNSSKYRTTLDTPIGLTEICGDDEFIHSLYFLDEDDHSIEKANDSTVIMECTKQLTEYFKGIRKEFTFPFHQNGTAFQTKIWDLLTEIPYGKTISYAELAKRYGDIKAIRAAGTANGRNALSIIVPCHRVIGSNGKLIGYGGGLWRKQWLLEYEAKYAYGTLSLF
jgi:methylated-DNA-[protein]-cysteine S-methyltransferase